MLVWVVGDQIVDGGETGNSFRQALHFQSLGLRLHQTLIYEATGQSAPKKARYPRTHQYLFVFSNGKPRVVDRIADVPTPHAGRASTGTVRESDGSMTLRKTFIRPPLVVRGSVWRYDPGFNKCHPGEGHLPHRHPATFPRRLAADCIRSYSAPGDLVLDPMAGSGTTLRAAANLGRTAVGVEVNPEYCELIRERMQQEVLL